MEAVVLRGKRRWWGYKMVNRGGWLGSNPKPGLVRGCTGDKLPTRYIASEEKYGKMR